MAVINHSISTKEVIDKVNAMLQIRGASELSKKETEEVFRRCHENFLVVLHMTDSISMDIIRERKDQSND